MTPQLTQPESNAKPRVRLNAFRLGLTGQVYVLTEDEAPHFRKHYTAIQNHYQPVGPIEQSLVDQIANGIWRLQRSQAIEEGIFAMDSAPDSAASPSIPGPTRTWLSLDKAFDLLGKYERRIQRSLDRDKVELQQLQSARKEETAMAMDRAVGLHRLAKSEGKSFDPGIFRIPSHAPESVFSADAIAAESDRRESIREAERRLAQAQRQPKAA
jgi:hypothetical protein